MISSANISDFQDAVARVFVNILWLYSWICVETYGNATFLYVKYDWIRGVVDWLEDTRLFLKDSYDILFSHKKSEPDVPDWFYVCALNPGNHFSEMYRTIPDREADMNNNRIEENKEAFFSTFTPYDAVDVVGITRFDGKYFVTRNQLPSVTTEKRSTFEPMSVTYTHPLTEGSVSIELPTSMFMVGNELFSPAFVCRALFYQKEAFYFDGNYTLSIIDKNINMYTVDASQYVHVGEGGIEVRELDFIVVTKPPSDDIRLTDKKRQ